MTAATTTPAWINLDAVLDSDTRAQLAAMHARLSALADDVRSASIDWFKLYGVVDAVLRRASGEKDEPWELLLVHSGADAISDLIFTMRDHLTAAIRETEDVDWFADARGEVEAACAARQVESQWARFERWKKDGGAAREESEDA